MVADRLRPGCTVLELGCSTGHFAKILSERGRRVVGVELDTEAAVPRLRRTALAALHGTLDRYVSAPWEPEHEEGCGECP